MFRSHDEQDALSFANTMFKGAATARLQSTTVNLMWFVAVDDESKCGGALWYFVSTKNEANYQRFIHFMENFVQRDINFITQQEHCKEKGMYVRW